MANPHAIPISGPRLTAASCTAGYAAGRRVRRLPSKAEQYLMRKPSDVHAHPGD
jgi:hypothetical protein